MNEVHSLLIDASRKLLELKANSKWAVQLPNRCPPVRWFGNAESTKPKILTLGANPSRREFLSDTAEQAMEKVRRTGDQSLLSYLEPPDNRFRLLYSGEQLANILTSESLRAQIIASYNVYFDRKPYSAWFGHNREKSYKVEGFLRGFGASYYNCDTASSQALHIDLFPFATLDDFGQIKDLADEALFADGWAQNLVERLISALSPSVLILFGRTNCHYFAEYIDRPDLNMKWCPFGSGKYFVGRSERFTIPLVGLSTNLGNPKGFDRVGLRAFGAYVQRTLHNVAIVGNSD